MKVRAGLAEAFVRLALLCAAGALLRSAEVALRDWREQFNGSLEHDWGGWAAIALGLQPKGPAEEPAPQS